MPENIFHFAIGQEVTIDSSGESGTVIGRAKYIISTNSYFVRYKASDGRATEAWWQQDALSAR